MASTSRDSKSSQVKIPKELPLNFLKEITDNFSDERIISGDPFGTLYKGVVPDDGRVIAVKKLRENAPMPAGETFTKEVQNIMVLKHENLVALVGFCSDTHKELVPVDGRYIQADITQSFLCYEYCPNGTLYENLFGIKGTKHIKKWDTCFKIIKGVCQGLQFLHTLDIPIMHMDLKPENIWLGENMVPKIGNFALSRVFGQEQTRLCTQNVVGSYGYMAPEYLYRGEISAQSDIYSLGLTMIEIATGEKNSYEVNQPSARKYIDTIRQEWTSHRIASTYSSLNAQCLQQVRVCIDIGLNCVEIDQKCRPSIEEIVEELNRIN